MTTKWTNVLGQADFRSHNHNKKIGCEYYYLGDQLIEEAPIYADGSVAFERNTHWLYAPN